MSRICVCVKKTALGMRVDFYFLFIFNDSLTGEGTSTTLSVPAVLLNALLFQHCKLLFFFATNTMECHCRDMFVMLCSAVM